MTRAPQPLAMPRMRSASPYGSVIDGEAEDAVALGQRAAAEVRSES